MMDDLLVPAIASLVFMGSIVVAHEVGWSRGTQAATSAATTREATLRADQAEALGKANQRERAAELAASQALTTQSTTYRQEIENERKKRLRFESDVRTGAVRLSIPIVSAHCAATAGADTPAGSASGPEARAELDPQAAIDLAAIASDGDDAIRQLNTCVDAYATVRLIYNQAADDQAR